MRVLVSALSDRFDHPLLASLLGAAAALYALGYFVDALALESIPDITAAWLAVYATGLAGLGLLGYLLVFAARYASVLRDKAGPQAG